MSPQMPYCIYVKNAKGELEEESEDWCDAYDNAYLRELERDYREFKREQKEKRENA